MGKHVNKHIKVLSWVDDKWIKRVLENLPLEPETLYCIAELSERLQIPRGFFIRHSLKLKTRTRMIVGGSMVVCAGGRELEPLLRSWITRKPPKAKKVSVKLKPMKLVPPPSERTPTDLKVVEKIYGPLETALDKEPLDVAREVSYRLARRYSRSNTDREVRDSDQETIPSEDQVQKPVEKPET